MIDEFRRVTFSAEALKVALQGFLRKRVAMLPDADIASVEVSAAEVPSATVRFQAAGGLDPRELEIPGPQLAAAMIESCIRSRIPVPRAARKYIERAGDGVALCFSLQTRRVRV